MLKTRLLRFRMLSACGDLMYSSTICFQRRLHSQPRKKLCTFLIFRSSAESSPDSHNKLAASLMALSVFGSLGVEVVAAALKLPRPTGVAEKDDLVVSLRRTQIWKQLTVSYRVTDIWVIQLTSARSFRISEASSSHCCVYCHLAVFSLSTTWSRWTCFCSSSSFWSSNLLKLKDFERKAKRKEQPSMNTNY